MSNDQQAASRCPVAGPAIRSTPYAAYADIDELLTLQHPQTDEPTEPGFIILSQVKELLFTVLHTEFTTARDALAGDRLSDALWTLRRAVRVQRTLLSCWDFFDAMSPGEFAAFREVLGTASGFQSFTYRRLEFLLGNKNPHLVRPHENTPHHAEMVVALHQPSLYDAALRYVAGHGVDLPADVLHRDLSVPYRPSEPVEAAWRSVHREPDRYRDLFLLAEALMDVATSFARWRYTHLLVVQRILGGKPGTGGTGGASWLTGIAEHRFFPELWSIRSTL